MYRISKEFSFSASHQLKGLPDKHPCSRLHGHNYKVIFEFEAKELDKNGFVIDFNELKPIGKFLDSYLDHRHLNDIVGFNDNPTSEVIAFFLYHKYKKFFAPLCAVTVKETEKTSARYCGAT